MSHPTGLRGWTDERIDRRGFGQTRGEPTVALLTSDALETFDQVRSMARGHLVVHEFSLGASVAGIVARHRAVDSLVIEGGTPSVAEYVDVHLPWYVKLVARPKVSRDLEQTNTADALRDYAEPLLIAVGERDRDTVPELSRRLFGFLKAGQKELLIVPDAGHYALTTPAGSEAYAAFLRRVLP